MHPATHLLLSWSLADAAASQRRDRALVTIAGIAPDFDGAGVIVELATRDTAAPLLWWSRYHHVLGHNLFFGLLLTLVVLAAGRQRLRCAAAGLAAFHLHLACDILGSRGPDGFQWPICYLFPFSSDFLLQWSGQWELDAWPNLTLTLALLLLTLYLAWRRGYSVLELVSTKMDAALVKTLRGRFGSPRR